MMNGGTGHGRFGVAFVFLALSCDRARPSERPDAGVDITAVCTNTDAIQRSIADPDLVSASASELYGLRVGARWTYLRSGGVLRWKEITACEDVPLLDEKTQTWRTVRAYVRENRSSIGTTSVHYLVVDEQGVHRIRRDDVDKGRLVMFATYDPPSPRLLNGPYALCQNSEFALRTAEFTWPAPMRDPTFRGANDTSAKDVVIGMETRGVVAGTFRTLGIDRQWAAHNAHNVQSFYAPGVGEVVEVTIFPTRPLPEIQVEELVAHTPGYGTCDGSPMPSGGTCDPPLLVCDKPWGLAKPGCTDPRVDAANCGSCGTTCPSGVCAGGTCQVSACPLACEGTAICCPSAWHWNVPGCTSPSRDRWNCGGCGVVCGGGTVCDHGACTCAPGFRDCGNGCRDVLADPGNCGACGKACGGDTPNCSMGICHGACSSLNLESCNDLCVDLDWDDQNCGACGRACGEGTGTVQCRYGECVPCAKAGFVNCGNTCFDLAWSDNNCGACGNVCAAGQVCAFGKCIGGDGTCGAEGCPDGDKICCNGSCIDPKSSDSDCGGCGVAVCAGGCTEACRQGICTLVDCGGGDD